MFLFRLHIRQSQNSVTIHISNLLLIATNKNHNLISHITIWILILWQCVKCIQYRYLYNQKTKMWENQSSRKFELAFYILKQVCSLACLNLMLRPLRSTRPFHNQCIKVFGWCKRKPQVGRKMLFATTRSLLTPEASHWVKHFVVHCPKTRS